jgi:hypothetical protein
VEQFEKAMLSEQSIWDICSQTIPMAYLLIGSVVNSVVFKAVS